jgi:hypothetical protein
MKSILLSLLLSVSVFSSTWAQHLSRQAVLGLAPAALDASSSSQELGSSRGIRVARVFPGFSATAMGVQENDVLVQINEQAINSSQELFAVAAQLRAGDSLACQVYRDGKLLLLFGTATPRPLETSEFAEVRYEETPFQDGYLRCVVHKPRTKEKRPAIFFIQGFPCQTMEAANPIHPVKRLLEDFAKAGYVVFRVEKPGMGDSEGSLDCAEIDIATEIEAFKAGMKQLRTYDFVDQENIFLFGHSLGAFEAPFVAQDFPVRGIAGYGFVADRWHDYNLDLISKQMPVLGSMTYAEAQNFLDEARPVLYDFYFNKLSPAQLDKKYGNGSEILTKAIDYDGQGYIYGRSYQFWQSLNDLNLVKAYSQLGVPVLSMYGEADVEALDKSSVEYLTTLLNAQEAGLGTFRFIPGTDHAFIEVGSQADGMALKQSGAYRQHLEEHYNPAIGEETIRWMEKCMEE